MGINDVVWLFDHPTVGIPIVLVLAVLWLGYQVVLKPAVAGLKEWATEFRQMHHNLRKVMDPEYGDLVNLRRSLTQYENGHKARFVSIDARLDLLQQDVTDVRRNGHIFGDRFANLEDRVQQGAEELDDIRRIAHINRERIVAEHGK